MNFYDVLAAEKWDGGIPTVNFFDLLFAQSISGEQWQVYEGTLPATIISTGDDLRQYQIWGNVGGVGEEVDITGLSEPLCGIDTHTDSLNLSTGILTRRIKKLILTGEENWTKRKYNNPNHTFEYNYVRIIRGMCSHYATYLSSQIDKVNGIYLNNTTTIIITDLRFTTATDFKSYLAAQYSAGTPVTVWYALAEPEVSTITVPSGLTGTIEGYLIQDGTPTPEAPIYPTANGVKQADDTYSIKYGYKLDISVSDGTNVTTTPIYIGSDPLDKDEYVDYTEQKVYRMIDSTLTPTDPPVPLPALPTCEGTTVIDYAGQSVAPEKVLLEYAKGGN